MKRVLVLFITAVLLTGCRAQFDVNNEITVISREDGSGTRSAFIELLGIEEKDADGNKKDNTIITADINDSTGILLANVAGNPNAIGYVSMGSLNDTVKAVSVDGVAPTAENVANGTYGIARPFNIAAAAVISEVTDDFIGFIMSSDGQAIVADMGNITVSETSAYAGSKPSGRIVVGGSSSVTPLMEKLKEGYNTLNPNATIEIQQSDSTTGMNSVINGICDIGMASRELKDTEIAAGLTSMVIARDGIAIIIHNENTADDLTAQQVKDIYTGVSVKWSDVIAENGEG